MTKDNVASNSAFRRPALYALSVAFTASIVAYPDLPRDIPPLSYVDGEQVFWGGPFLAFFLPMASIVIWWLLDRLDSHSRKSNLSIERAGAKTALFLAAFHMTMLIGLVGAQVWLTRVLGLMIGIFMIASRDRSQRLGGYIRSVAGIAVCIASLSGLGIARLIVVAAFLEAAVYVGARCLLSIRKRAAVGALLLCCCSMAIRAEAQGLAGPIKTLPAFIDATVPKLMQERHVAGTAVIVVHEGRVAFARGYGKAQLESDISVEPSRTLFRIGSVTKLFTATAAIQLAEAGRLDLHRDVREYLPDVPLRYATTTHQLLTHTAGLDERFAGAYTDSPQHLQRLSDHLRRYTPEQVFRPGAASSYSNYNYALAGLVIERLSGLAYEHYIADRILGPMRMTSTTALQPPEKDLNHDLARGYRWTGSRLEPIPYNYTQAAPAGAITTTVTDMGRFMLAVLAGGSLDGERILSPTSLRMMLETQYTPHPLIPGTTYGFSPMISHGQRLLFRGGTLGDQAAMLILVPSDKLGIFIASNALPGIGDFLFEPMMTHLAGREIPPAPPKPMPDAVRRAARFEGTYRAYRQVRNEMSRLRALMPVSQSRVVAESDGTLRWQGRRWLEIEPLVFRSVDSLDYIVFRENARGEIVGVDDFERIGWQEQAPFHVGVLLSCVIAFLTYLMSRVLRTLKRRPASPEGRFARVCAVFVAITNLAFVVGLASLIRDLGAITPLPLPILMWLSLPLASVAVTALLPAFAASSWKEKWWTRRERFGYSIFVILAVAFMTSLNYWKLLGIRY